MAKATVINPVDGAENSAAPHTELTSANVPINSGRYILVLSIAILPAPRSARGWQNSRFKSVRSAGPGRLWSLLLWVVRPPGKPPPAAASRGWPRSQDPSDRPAARYGES